MHGGFDYTIAVENATITNANGDYDLIEIAPADDRPVYLKELHIKVLSEIAEAQEEWLRIGIYRGATTGGNGSATTPRPMNGAAPAAAMAVETIGATIASAGTEILLWPDAFNVRAGYDQVWTPDAQFVLKQTSTLHVVRLIAAAADDLTLTVTAVVEEV